MWAAESLKIFEHTSHSLPQRRCLSAKGAPIESGIDSTAESGLGNIMTQSTIPMPHHGFNFVSTIAHISNNFCPKSSNTISNHLKVR
jgi:hypothetical protein